MGSESWPDYTFCDMHSHMLPGVDDGSVDMDMSLRMIDIALDNNIDTVILTPHHKGGHHNVTPAKQARLIQDMADAAYDAGIDAWDTWEYIRHTQQRKTELYDELGSFQDDMPPEILFYPGNEIMYDSGVVERLRDGLIQTMAGTSYVLVEFRPYDEFSRIQEGLRTLSYEGYRPILAHCERYECLREDESLVQELWRNQVYLQVNADDVHPRALASIPKFVGHLLKEEKVSFISTDAHRDTERTPRMMDCWRYLMKKCDSYYVRDIMRENVLRVIRDEEL